MELTDVNVSELRGYAKVGVGFIKSFVVGVESSGTARWYAAFEIGDQDGSQCCAQIYFEDMSNRDRFVSEIDAAIKAWRIKYAELNLVTYRGRKG